MAYNPSWPKWVQASVADHFKTVATTEGFSSLVDGLEERTTAFQDSPQRLEIRINGPFIRERSKDDYIFNVTVNILIFSHMDGTASSVYAGTNIAGKMAQAASDLIPVYKYGAQAEDDASRIGCLTLTSGSGGVNVFHFGEVNAEDRLRQLGVDANFKMNISL